MNYHLRGLLNITAWNRMRYTLYAPVYDAVAERIFERPRRQALAKVNWQTGQRILIVGAGTGLDLPWLPHGIEIHASDLSAAMVTRLQTRAAKLGLDIDSGVMDAAQLDYPNGYFEVVVMHLIIAVMPYPEAGLREAYRVLNKEGQLCVMDKFQSDQRPASLMRHALNLLTTLIATDITRQARPLLHQAGFHIEHDSPVLMGSLFRALLARKT
ncbi:class I SAM-dependent methyltransferase [Phytohalomonas tamaricis]|uniref:class I SAM-dependent methyltransferase n=1 Tax=Phytohalomonas tamaricis TaxID=2081032 RepID=UPI000D0B0542|nr:class I SAM-dependent methyltransferase [Phytohalomonas tamaricis]